MFDGDNNNYTVVGFAFKHIFVGGDDILQPLSNILDFNSK